jgi:hypothetical protein
VTGSMVGLQDASRLLAEIDYKICSRRPTSRLYRVYDEDKKRAILHSICNSYNVQGIIQAKVKCAMICRKEGDKEDGKLRPVALASCGYYQGQAGHFCDIGVKLVNDKPPAKASKAGSLGYFKRKRLGNDQVFYVADARGTCKFLGNMYP